MGTDDRREFDNVEGRALIGTVVDSRWPEFKAPAAAGCR